MLYQPRDEMALRHLFSTRFSEEQLRMRYVGPVLNASDQVETSPDALILDMRVSPYKLRRCEFKYEPASATGFAHNGTFSMAVTWSLPSGVEKAKLLERLRAQNGCQELVVLSEYRCFRELPEYHYGAADGILELEGLREAVLHRDRTYPMVYSLALACLCSPQKFRVDKMTRLLSERFQEVRDAKPKGRTNYALVFTQTKPPFVEHMHGRSYRWIPSVDPTAAFQSLSQIIQERFAEQPPSELEVRLVI